MNPAEPEITIIVPAYNEEARLPDSLQKIAAYIQNSGRQTEVLVVDDGSTDATAAVAQLYCQKLPGLRIISNGENRGKGFSVRDVLSSSPTPISPRLSRKPTSSFKHCKPMT
jgi:glycosyltransferase involved in cell wall biosynthesis